MEEIKTVLNLLIGNGYDIYDILDVANQILDAELKVFECLDCQIGTMDLNQYYMVHDELWLQANPDDDGMLCFKCLEIRLGRELRAADFTDAPVNYQHRKNFS
jgi:hypothetical protein